ncbi:MAG: hypothetical protein SFU53_01745 [Terrimicrobiaceae bacterium]|nr:hypothetical protein [Terrimicrobiaceae bacterium]
MNLEVISHAGWNRNLRLANETAEVIITLDVGPRVISYRTHEGQNVFKNYDVQLGGQGENEWMIRGGHRLWIAPEDEVISYHKDNGPVDFQTPEHSNEVLIETVSTEGATIAKTLGVQLAVSGSKVTVTHTARNAGDEPIQIATWGLSVMAPGGIEIIPQPRLGEHPRDLLPNRGMVLWPYTDLSDARWHLGQRYFMLRQSDGFPPTKMGLAHREKWIAYVIGESLFIKAFDHIQGANYPDGGCNFETFTNDEMLEIESLSPLATLAPGESVSHAEQWHLFPITEPVQIESEDSLFAWLSPFLKRASL